MTGLLIGILMFIQTPDSLNSPGPIPVLHDSLIMEDPAGVYLTALNGWEFTTDDPFNTTGSVKWVRLQEPISQDPAELDSLWKGYGWYRINFEVDSTFSLKNAFPVVSPRNKNLAMEIYLDREMILKIGSPSETPEQEEIYSNFTDFGPQVFLQPNKQYELVIKRSFHRYNVYNMFVPFFNLEPYRISIGFIGEKQIRDEMDLLKQNIMVFSIILVVILLLSAFYLYIYIRVKDQKENLWLVILMSCIGLVAFNFLMQLYTVRPFWFGLIIDSIQNFALGFSITLVPLVTYKLLKLRTPLFWRAYALLGTLFYVFQLSQNLVDELVVVLILSVVGGLIAIYKAYNSGTRDILLPALSILGLPLILTFYTIMTLFGFDGILGPILINIFILFLTLPVGLSIYQAKKFLRLHNEMDDLVDERTAELEKAYNQLEQSLSELKSAQQQLVQQEKLASLGQLTAGIAHEIKNPLNFVNNFSDLSLELVDEVREEIVRAYGDTRQPGTGEIEAILSDIEANLRKIHEHGSRADSIVRSMLQHSRGGSGEMEPADLNALVKEYVNLAFHGMRAGSNPIDVTIDMNLDPEVGKADLIAEDFSRVILNLCNNAFDALREKAKVKSEKAEEYKPKLSVRTSKSDNYVSIEIEDNGPGIPDEIKDKIMQPFFTTKKGTQGTGLGLSITNDIIKAHGGRLEINSSTEKGSVFSIYLEQKE